MFVVVITVTWPMIREIKVVNNVTNNAAVTAQMFGQSVDGSFLGWMIVSKDIRCSVKLNTHFDVRWPIAVQPTFDMVAKKNTWHEFRMVATQIKMSEVVQASLLIAAQRDVSVQDLV